jgi:hypothetical protein
MVSRTEGADQNGLATRFAVTANGAPIGVPLGEKGRPNAHPWFGNFDGDGRPDLLVGQNSYNPRAEKEWAGALRIYKNTSKKGPPQFGDPLWFDDLVPTGLVPGG